MFGPYPLHPLSYGADTKVMFLIVVEVFRPERIRFESRPPFHVEIVVLDEGFHAVFCHEAVVFLRTVAGVNSISSLPSDEFSWTMTSSICPKGTCIFFIRRSRFRSTVFRQLRKVYLLALDSIFVPSMYSTFRLMKPLEESRSTTWVNTSSISFLTRLRKRLMVMKSGFSYPARYNGCHGEEAFRFSGRSRCCSCRHTE